MATAKRTKANIEFLLVKAELKGIPEKGLLRSPQYRAGRSDLAAGGDREEVRRTGNAA